MASIPGRGDALILARSKALRLLTLFLFYFTQGFPIGLFFVAVPGWMAANDMGTADTAAVVGTSALPWTLKLVNGFLIDRYAYLPMGRRRAWIISAQWLIVMVFLAGAAIAPLPSEVLLLSAFGFIANAAVTFQDVGIDSLAVDIMPEDERAKAGGIMFGGQMLGISAATAMNGYLFENFSLSAGLAVSALVPAAVALYGMAIRERDGERRLPWSPGVAHPRNLHIQVEAWVPLLKSAFLAIITPLSLVLLPILLVRALPSGAYEAFHPVLTAQIGGWPQTGYTNIMSTATLLAGLVGLTVGGWLVDAIGAQRALRIFMALLIAMWVTFASMRSLWTEGWLLSALFLTGEVLGTFVAIAMIPLCMRMCSPAVAATQFTIYMAVSNLGRPLGAALAVSTTPEGGETLLYWALAAIWAVAVLVLFLVRFPSSNRDFEEAAHDLPQAGGLAPVEN